MKTLFRISMPFLLLMPFVFFSCEEDEPIRLVANAGEDFSGTVATVIALDGSASSGPQNFSYEWSFQSGPISTSDVNLLQLSNTSSAQTTFTPPKNGQYVFNLRIEHNGSFSEDQVTVTITGVLSLPSVITSNVVLNDIDFDPEKPDYEITGIIRIQSGGSITVNSNVSNMTLQFSENAGIIIEGGSANFTSAKLTSINGWKGILMTSGSLNGLGNVQIVKAGKSTLEGQTETASLIMTGGTLTFQSVLFQESQGTHDWIINDGTINENTSSNVFSTSKPIKADIKYVSRIGSNTFPANYDYIHLTTPGAGTISTSVSTNGFQFFSHKYYIDGDFTAGSDVIISNSVKIFMKPGAGFLQSSQSLTSSGCLSCNPSSGASIEGLNGEPWKGIAIGAGATISLSNIEIKNAGSEVFNTGSFSSAFKAAIYFASNNNGVINESKITTSGGYGIYHADPFVYLRSNSTTFTGTSLAAISANVTQIPNAIGQNPNAYTMPIGIPAVEVRSTNPNSFQPSGEWRALTNDNYYLVTGNLVQGGSTWTLQPGVKLKFKTGKSIMIQGGLFNAIGSEALPIVLDSEAGTPGTWPGIILESTYKIEHCQIKNGGEALLFRGGVSPATSLANVVFNYGGISNANTFKNNTISGGAGYGVLVEATKQNPDVLNVANANTFTNNVSGDVIVK